MSESIGARLRQARERRQLNLQQISEATKIRSHYLQALENDDLSAMPSAAQSRGFLRIYADFLGFGLEELLPPPPVALEEANRPSAESPGAAERQAGSKAGAPLSRIVTRIRGAWSLLGNHPAKGAAAVDSAPSTPTQESALPGSSAAQPESLISTAGGDVADAPGSEGISDSKKKAGVP